PMPELSNGHTRFKKLLNQNQLYKYLIENGENIKKGHLIKLINQQMCFLLVIYNKLEELNPNIAKYYHKRFENRITEYEPENFSQLEDSLVKDEKTFKKNRNYQKRMKKSIARKKNTSIRKMALDRANEQIRMRRSEKENTKKKIKQFFGDVQRYK
ncbi:hypothetical protein M153_3420008402, partial [Pseudoloma neurophilia]